MFDFCFVLLCCVLLGGSGLLLFLWEVMTIPNVNELLLKKKSAAVKMTLPFPQTL